MSYDVWKLATPPEYDEDASQDEAVPKRTLQDLIGERRALLQEMRAERDITARETLRAQVAVLDGEIAEARRAKEAGRG